MALGTVNVAGVMQSDIEEVKQDIQYVSNLIGEAANTGATVTEGTVMAKLNALIEASASSGGGIKSVQRGSFLEEPQVSANSIVEINISTVNPSKTFVIFRGGAAAGYASSPSVSMGYLWSLSSNKLKYGGTKGSVTVTCVVSYEVVEFY